MSYDSDQNESALPADGKSRRTSVDQLPRYFRTPQNKKFLSSTLDQFTNPGVIEKINGYVGSREAKAVTLQDNYVEDVSKERTDYQFEPVSLYEDFIGNTRYYSDYNDYTGLLKTYSANLKNHSKTNEQEFYAWNPSIDLSKFCNFREYYWLPDGPQEVAVRGQTDKVISTYRLETIEEDNSIALLFHPNGLTKNPDLKLYRGQTYRFNIESPGNPLSIALYRGVDPDERLDDSTVINQLYTSGVSLTLNDDNVLLNQSSFVNPGYIESGVLEFTIPDDAPNTLYFISQYDLNVSSRLKIYDIEENTSIDVENEILGKRTYRTSDGWDLSNGMKVYFTGNVTPAKYSIGSWYVEGVGDEIELVSVNDLQVPAVFTTDSKVPFDANGFDRVPFSDAKSFAGTKDYIVANKSCADRNAWARYNRWFHKDVITKSAELNSQTFDLNEDSRGKRPIIEFDRGLKLFNNGTKAKANVDLLDTYTNDVRSKIEGQPGYSVDGIELAEGMRVVFLNDTDNMIYGKVFQVKFIIFNGNSQITLIETNDTMPLKDETILINLGTKNAGTMYFFNGTTWKKAQEKTGINQAPLFDMFDENGISFSDEVVYPNSDFTGNRIFSYKVGEGANDPELGFPLTYKNINNTGDIVFGFGLLNEKFSYEISNSVFNKGTNTGYLKKYDATGNNFNFINGWIKSPVLSKQYVVRKYTGDLQTNNFIIDVYDKSGSIADLKSVVYVNNNLKLENVDYTFENNRNNEKVIKFYTDLNSTDIIVVKTHTDQADKNINGYYEFPHNFERNPLNEDITEFTLGEVNDHLDSIVPELDGFTGTQPGPNNIRDLGDIKKYGRKFLQHSGPINLPLFAISNKENNLISAINFAKDEYSKYKRAFIQASETLELNGTTREQVDQILLHLAKDKKTTMPFYNSDMVGIGAFKKIEHTVLDSDLKFYALSNMFTLNELSEKAVYVYVNDVQAYHNIDYQFTNEGFIQFLNSFTLNVDDKIDIYEYETTNGSYIPETPTVMGMFPAYQPEIFVDTTYRTPVTVVRGHDGSILVGYDDYRDQLLLELEKRFYNNIKVTYDTNIFDIYDYIGGEFRNTKISRQDINDVTIADFLSWTKKAGNVDYTDNSFVTEAEPFTYNYKFATSDTGRTLNGFWRGVYTDAYDTDRPNTHPWEMLGLSIKPSWWETKYGPAPYTSDNLVMWEDIEKGIIRSSDTIVRTDKKFIRPNLTKHIPVTQTGKVSSPLDSGYINEFSFRIQSGENFGFGDNTPTENAWRRSSEYPFALLKAIILNKPAQVVGVGFDRSRIKRDVTGQLVYSGDNLQRIKLSNLKFTNTLDSTGNKILTCGLINYIYSYMSSDITTQYSNFVEKLSKLKQKVAFKVGGFADKSKLKLVLDSRTPTNKGNVFVPFENYKINLIQSSPLQTVAYSGVIIERVEKGYKVSGYDKENPVFEYRSPISASNDPAITVGGLSENFLFWTEGKQYVAGKIVKFQNQFYRVNENHVAGDSFEQKFYSKLSSLPIVGGATASLRKNYSEIISKLPYGTIIKTVQDLVDFLQGYEKRLIDLGFEFDYFNRETEAVENFNLGIKEFLFYTTQNWALGSIITLSPGANRLKFGKSYFVIDSVRDNIFGYKTLNVSGTAIKDVSLNINRDVSNSVELFPKDSQGLYFAKLGLVQKDHAVILDNTTVFNDTIYNPASGYRQQRINVVGYRTNNWNGNLDIPGFIYDEAIINEWQQWQDYGLGDIVKYKEYYYSANNFLTGTSTFNASNWNRLESKPESGLKTNFDYKANQFADFYDLDTDNFDTEQQRLAQHLIGYQKREYLNNIIQDEISQYKFYQGFIKDKGTLNSLTKLFDKLGSANKDSIEFYEEWAIRKAQYGATDVFDELEYQLDEKQFRIEPQIIELVDIKNEARTDLVYQYTTPNVYIKPNNYTTKPFPSKWSTDEYSKTAGYVSLDQINFLVKTPEDILALDIANVPADNFIWVTSEKNSWNVYQHVKTSNRVLLFEKTDTGFNLTFDSTPEITEGETFGIQFVIDSLDGFYKVNTITENVVNVVADITTDDQSLDLGDSTTGIITKLLSKRYASPDLVNADINEYGLRENDTIWIDNVSNNKFGVFKNQKIVTGKQEITNSEAGDGKFGSTFDSNDSNGLFVIGRPDDEKVFVYNRASEGASLNIAQTIDVPAGYHSSTSGFGQKVKLSHDGQFLFISAPLASNVKSRYLGEIGSVTGQILTNDIVSDRGTLWKALRETDDDSSTIHTDSQDWEQIYKIPADDNGSASSLTNQGIVYVYKKQLDSTFFLLEQFISSDPTDNEKFGIGLETAFSTDEKYQLFVRSEGNNGRIYIYDTLYIEKEFKGTQDSEYRGQHNTIYSYRKNEIVWYEGSLYKALVDIAPGGAIPTDINSWITTDVGIDRFGYLPYSAGILDGDNDSTAFNNTINAGKNIDVSANGEVLTFTAYNNSSEEFQVYVYRKQENRYAFYEVISAPQVDMLWGDSLALSDDGNYIAVGANLADVVDSSETGIDQGLVYIYKYNSTTMAFESTQILQAPNSAVNERFGYKLDFAGEKLCVLGINGKNLDSTTFDNTATTFDNGTTTITNISTRRPQAYTFELLNDRYTVSEVVDYESYYNDDAGNTLTRNLATARDVELVYTNNHLYLGFEGLSTSGTRNGLVFDLRSDRDTVNWTTLASATDFLNYEKMKGSFIYDKVTSDLITYLDFIDPIQGKIANAAERELDFKLYYDPAVYNIGSTNTGTVNPWAEEKVGKLLWDLSAVRWYNPYQKNSEYSANVWNKVIPGYSVDIYEWVESKLLPEQWDDIADTTEGLSQGISGKSRYGNLRYTRQNVYDPITGLFSAKYFYWVKNTKVLPAMPNRNISASTVASLIEDPASNGYKFLAMFGSDNFGIFNCRSLIKDKDTILHFEYYNTTEVKENNLHREYDLLTEGLETSQPNNRLVTKWIDSLVGYDDKKTPVPDPSISSARRYGILDEPLQTMFVNKAEALKQVIERINLVLSGNLIVDEFDISGFSKKDPEPSAVSREYDQSVDTESLLRFIGTSKISQASLSLTVTDGRITGVNITNAGRGYIDPAYDSANDTKRRGPKVTIQGTGTGAEIETYINNLGQVIEAVIVNQGRNYSQSTVVTVRPFTALVKADSTLLGFWATYIWNTTDKEWVRVNNQGYDASLYWEYKDWYKSGYSSSTAIDYLVPGSYALEGLKDELGDIVKVESIGSGGWLLLYKIDNQPEVDYTVNYQTIGRQNGTLQLSSLLYNNAKFGFDKAVYDSALYDRDAGQEIRILLNTIKENVFVDNLAVEWNKLFFSSIRYILAEQPNVDWIFKTAFIKAKHNVGELSQKVNFKNDNLESYTEYVNEVKPYSTKIREYLSAYESVDPTATNVTDFDLPPRYDEQQGKIIPENAQVIDSEIKNYSSFVTTYPQRNWFDNVGFEVTDVKITQGGSGWESSPTVTISGGGGPTITGTATISGDVVTGIIFDGTGKKYITKPDVTFTGTKKDEDAYGVATTDTKAVAILGNSPVRSTHMIIKFDRVSGTFQVTDLNVSATFTGTGSQILFDLKWPMSVKPADIEIIVNSVEQLSSDYSVSNILDTTASYERYYGQINFTVAPSKNAVISVKYKKDIDYLNAEDRINFFYNPTSGQYGKDLAQLMDGVDYGGVQIDTASFGAKTGFDQGAFGIDAFDDFDTNFEDEVFILDGSTANITVSKPFEPGVTYNIYYKSVTAGASENPIRLDDPDWVGDSSIFTNPDAIMRSIVGDGITNSFALDVTGINTTDGDTIIVRKSTSDGAVTPTGVIFDTQLTGGDLTNIAGKFSTATGIAAGEIVVDGDGFVTPTTSKGPEENVPGQILDTLDIQVYERVNDGQGMITVQNFTTDGDSAEYPLEELPATQDSVIVKLDNIVLSPAQYEIDYVEKILRISDSSLLPVGIHLSVMTIGTNGSNILDSDTFTADGVSKNFITYYSYVPGVTAVVAINGVVTTNFFVSASGSEYGEDADKVMITLGDTPKANSIITYTLYTGTGQQYSQLAIDTTFNRNVSTNKTHTFGVNGAIPLPFNKKPYSHNVLVKKGNTFLDAGYSILYTLTQERVYELDNWQFVDQTLIMQSDVLVYINDEYVEPKNYVYDTINGRLNLTSRSVGIAGDKMRVVLIDKADYFFVDTKVTLSNAANLIDYAPLDQMNFTLNDSTNVICTVQEFTKVGNDVTIILQGYERDLVLLAEKDDTPTLFLDDSTNFKIDSVTVVESNRLSLKEVPNEDVTIYVFSNHDINEFQRLSYRVAYDNTNAPEGSEDYLTKNLVSQGQIPLNKEIPGANYAWVFLNGKFLTAQVDYTLAEDGKTVLLSEAPEKNDQIEILYSCATVSKKKFAYRIFKDILNRYHYKRINSAKEYQLQSNLNWYDLNIVLKDSAGLDDPNRESGLPGIIFINGERIEYYVKKGNVLSQLQRGTLGTGIPEVHLTTSRVFHQGGSETIPYQDTTYTQNFTGDNSSTTFVLNWTPASINEFDVFVGGQRLLKSGYSLYNTALDQDSPGGDETVLADFTVENNILTLKTAPTAGTEIKVIRKKGKVWNDKGKSISSSKNTISKFLTDSSIKLTR